jgi:hypothetical protein
VCIMVFCLEAYAFESAKCTKFTEFLAGLEGWISKGLSYTESYICGYLRIFCYLFI